MGIFSPVRAARAGIRCIHAFTSRGRGYGVGPGASPKRGLRPGGGRRRPKPRNTLPRAEGFARGVFSCPIYLSLKSEGAKGENGRSCWNNASWFSTCRGTERSYRVRFIHPIRSALIARFYLSQLKSSRSFGEHGIGLFRSPRLLLAHSRISRLNSHPPLPLG